MRQHGAAVLRDADCVVPVPLHPRRRRARGFNQATELAAQLGLPVVDALRRTVATRPQMELPASRRHRNVRGVFAPARGPAWRPIASRIRGARVVVVDDVVTTGATVEACARVLRRLGARDVRVLTLARVARSRST
jgi:ComF family protein